MEEFGDKHIAQSFFGAYSKLIDENRDLLYLYLADDVILDWFGRTICGPEDVIGYMKYEVPKTCHILTKVEPSGPVQHRKKNVFIPKEKVYQNGSIQNSLSPMSPIGDVCNGTSKLLKELNSLTLENTDLCYRNRLPSSEMVTPPFSYPILRPEFGQGDGGIESPSMYPYQYIEAHGILEFTRVKTEGNPSLKNMKDHNSCRKWERTYKLHITYRATGRYLFTQDLRNTMSREFQICQIIYQDNARCRKNLALVFDEIDKQSQNVCS